MPIVRVGHFVETQQIEIRPTHSVHCGQKQEERMMSPRNLSLSQILIKIVTFNEDYAMP